MKHLFAYQDQLEEIKKHNTPLAKLNKVIDWEMFRDLLESTLY